MYSRYYLSESIRIYILKLYHIKREQFWNESYKQSLLFKWICQILIQKTYLKKSNFNLIDFEKVKTLGEYHLIAKKKTFPLMTGIERIITSKIKNSDSAKI